MAVLPIVIYPSPALRKKTQSVTDLRTSVTTQMSVLDYARDMEDTLEAIERGGAALAANQVGIEWQMFVTNQELVQETAQRCGDETESDHIRFIPPVIVNPTIIQRSPEQAWLDEGCLSFPGFGMKVRRHEWVTVQYETILKTEKPWKVWVEHIHSHTLTGFWAQVFQHEIDHLNGKLFVDHLPESKRLVIAKGLKKR